MADRINLLRRMEELDMSPQYAGVTKLICHISDEEEMTVGDDTGYTLEFENPQMKQEILASMLNKIRGYQYQPYRATGALLDPAAEMGDAVSTGGLYGGIYSRSKTFGRLMKADISAPTDEEIDHEYKFETKQERKVKRQVGDVKASLLIQAGLIESTVETVDGFDSRISQTESAISATVQQTGGSNTSGSFSWELTSNGHRWYANGGSSPVLSITANGLTVKGNGEFSGKITASSGEIGGFKIGENEFGEPALYTGSSYKYDGTAKGVHLSARGLRIGTKFQVSDQGVVNATDMYLRGSLYFYDKNKPGSDKWYSLTVANVRKGIEESYENYSSWTTGSGYGYDYNDACAAYASGPDWFTCGHLGIRVNNNLTYYFSGAVSITSGGKTYTVLGFQS